MSIPGHVVRCQHVSRDSDEVRKRFKKFGGIIEYSADIIPVCGVLP